MARPQPDVTWVVDGTFYSRTADGEMGGGTIGMLEAASDAPMRAPLLDRTVAAASSPPYPFFPQAGTLWQDLWINNFVDLGAGGTPLDYECTGYTYPGHLGHDSTLVGFREQAIGVPVFAALDGTVFAVHDGEADQETTALTGRPMNLVGLSHAGGYHTEYFHLKTNSVVVAIGQVVKAGTQLGLTGSSGNSTWPHLHFTSVLNGVAFEPSAGACRPGVSRWSNQTAIRRDVYVRSFTFGGAPFTGVAGLPFDQAARSGTYVRGASTLFFRLSLQNLPAAYPYRIVVVRPDGTIASDAGGTFANNVFMRDGWMWFGRNVSFNVTGAWTMELYANGSKIVSAPLTVVASAMEIVNRAPLAVASVRLDPPLPTTSDVPFCRVTPTSLYRRDPDYDVVRYRYRWLVRGALVRDVTSAALSDALAAGTMQTGDDLTCTVTPYDDLVAGPSASVTAGAVSVVPPTGLASAVSGATVTLTWQAPTTGLTPEQYVIEAGSVPGAANVVIFPTGSTATMFLTAGVPFGTYHVRVRNAAGGIQSDPSNEVVVVVGPAGCVIPGAPGNARLVSVNSGMVVVAWDAASGNPSTYVVEAGTATGAANLVNLDLASSATSLTAHAVPPGTYYVRFRAASACGAGSTSNEVVVAVP
jgi:hypothetical protein